MPENHERTGTDNKTAETAKQNAPQGPIATTEKGSTPPPAVSSTYRPPQPSTIETHRQSMPSLSEHLRQFQPHWKRGVKAVPYAIPIAAALAAAYVAIVSGRGSYPEPASTQASATVASRDRPANTAQDQEEMELNAVRENAAKIITEKITNPHFNAEDLTSILEIYPNYVVLASKRILLNPGLLPDSERSRTLYVARYALAEGIKAVARHDQKDFKYADSDKPLPASEITDPLHSSLKLVNLQNADLVGAIKVLATKYPGTVLEDQDAIETNCSPAVAEEILAIAMAHCSNSTKVIKGVSGSIRKRAHSFLKQASGDKVVCDTP